MNSRSIVDALLSYEGSMGHNESNSFLWVVLSLNTACKIQKWSNDRPSHKNTTSIKNFMNNIPQKISVHDRGQGKQIKRKEGVK